METMIQGPIRYPLAPQKVWPDWLPRAHDKVWQRCQVITEGECCTDFATYLIKSRADKSWSHRTCVMHTYLYGSSNYYMERYNA